MLWDKKLRKVLDEQLGIKSPHMLFHLSLPKLQSICELLGLKDVGWRSKDGELLKKRHQKLAEDWETSKQGGLHVKHLKAARLVANLTG